MPSAHPNPSALALRGGTDRHMGRSLPWLPCLACCGQSRRIMRAFGITSAVFALLAALAAPALGQVTPCRIGIVGNERFFGNEFVEVGMSGVGLGKFGTVGSNPPGFFGRQFGLAGIGMVGDNDGFGTGQDIRVDYFLPGSPEETWNVAASGRDYPASDSTWTMSYAGPTLDSATGIASMTHTAVTADGCLQVRQVHSLAPRDKSYQTRVTMTNTGGTGCPTYADVKFARSHDPDNTYVELRQ